MRTTFILLAGLTLPTAAYAGQPTGEGDPKEVSCMRVEAQTGKLGSDALCATNEEWAQVTKAGVKLDQFGQPIPKAGEREVGNHGCSQVGGGGIDGDGRHRVNFNCH